MVHDQKQFDFAKRLYGFYRHNPNGVEVVYKNRVIATLVPRDRWTIDITRIFPDGKKLFTGVDTFNLSYDQVMHKLIAKIDRMHIGGFIRPIA